jgi:hypothetical protein
MAAMDRHPFVALEAASPDIGLLAASLQNATREWRQELGEVDEEAIVWQPVPDMHSIGALILHIVDVEAWWIESVAAGKSRHAASRSGSFRKRRSSTAFNGRSLPGSLSNGTSPFKTRSASARSRP